MSAFHCKLASLALALAAVGGFVLLLVLAAHHPGEAPLLRILAFLWLVAAGAAKLVFDLTETVSRERYIKPSRRASLHHFRK
jgi:hypothetical protein